MASLDGKRGLIVGIANESSIAWACARAARAQGAQLAATWLNEKAQPHVAPLLDQLDITLRMPLDVTDDGQMATLFNAISAQWGGLDFLLHSIAFAPKADLQGRVTDSSRDGFALAMDISCHSFIRMARHAEPLMSAGGSLLTVSFLGGEAVIPHYGIMGPVKAALEASVRYLASELGPAGIRVNAISPGPIVTRAASGIAEFDALVTESTSRSPLKRPLAIDDVGPLCAFLASDGARAITGGIHFVDGGYNIIN
ncbi:Enoyl-[acyl-carrier-protein] reductase [NADH] [Bordetella sputigena]|uniref:enoyl-ACP reductase FabI n=1 Tax=Bordetella sputigena TaxID=1416810 RepID=UPI0039EDFAEB